ncbi:MULTISPECIES: FAD-dependent monooxygenase [Xanthomonas]|uniref:Alkyl hydroperoxide reductase subunit F n=2 Tax=Xanthomonas TaxID=338 RepID=A0A6N7Q632_9XANT|nr:MULTISPECIES: FAD-dependent monooxygenase [Xanthomonas]KAA8921140.1 FAD-binding monooxygenase [Xanthomonas sontii]KAB7772861.1 FAD-binding monooxygenase [Xanthomonas sp. LMG 12462]KAB7774657.1 FAD-binding monooxygenase [Xanthomonas sp. LMG 12459]MCW0386884.1 12-dehydrotetracycline 5-monooxygenase/anhydrotetracycline 6-monooxygenase [Xanthomonas sacchari]MCW0399164.1 12-dehydrotetracycline 5-monooxygenase/anhydrotetracycline 6-monooxygenase [Xanthomonas sacchari]
MALAPHPDGFDTDVIIIGGGPVGLTTACALAHHGVRFRIFEQRTQPKPHSRANNLWARPQELLASIGIRDALAERAYRITRINTLLNGKTVDPIDIAQVASPYPEVLYSGQDVIENVLARRIETGGAALERGRKVVGFEQDADGVSVTIATVNDDGEPVEGRPVERLRCRYLVGADGAEGFVRKQIGADFATEKLPHCMNRQLDAKLRWRRSTDFDHLWFFYYPKGFCGVLPVWEGYHRLFFLSDDAGIPDRDPTLEELQAIAREVTEDETLELSDPIWITHSRFQHGVTSRYADGRVFLVGDAGHLTLPAGGQGMNAGLQDAVGLAWRLAMALDGKAAPVLLESYGLERGGEHRRLDAQQEKGFRNSVYRGVIKDTAMGIAASFLPNIGALIQGTDDLQQLSVAYPDSPLNEDHLKGLREIVHRRVPHPGDRAPDAAVIAQDGASTTLFAHLYNPDGVTWGWALLLFDARQQDALMAMRDALAQLQAWEWIRPRLILGKTVPQAGDATALFDLDGVAHGAYGIEGDPAMVLVRPDGHIAFRGPLDAPQRLRAYCARIFGE